MNVNFLNDKRKMLRGRRWLAIRQGLKRALLATFMLAALGLAWHERTAFMDWLNKPAPSARQVTAIMPSESKLQARATSGGGTIYSWRDEHGVRTFSDQPPTQADDTLSAERTKRQVADELPSAAPAEQAGRLTRLRLWLKSHWPLKAQSQNSK